MYNRVVLIGRLGKDPEVFTGKETKVARLSVATTTYKKNADGTFTEETEWNRVVVFGDNVNRTEKMHKGDWVMVEGTLKTSKYTDKNGVEKYSTEILGVSKKISMGTGTPGTNAAPAAAGSNAATSTAEPDSMSNLKEDSDLPF